MSKQIKIGLDKVPAPVTKQFTQLIDIDGSKLYDAAGNPLVTEEDVSLGSTNNSDNALSVFTNNTSVGDLSLPIAEQFPTESEVSSSLLGIPRAEEQLSLFSDVATYGLDEDNWAYYTYTSATQPPEWYKKESPVYGRRHPAQFREGSNEQALYLKAFPSQYTFPRGPIEENSTAPTENYIKYMRFIALGRYLFDFFKDYDLDFSRKNFLDPDLIDVIDQLDNVVTQNNPDAYVLDFDASPARFTRTSTWFDVLYKSEDTQVVFDAIERWTYFYDTIRDNTAVFPTLLGSATTDYREDSNYLAIRAIVATRDSVLPGASSTWENFAILESQKSFRYQPGRASGFTFGSRMEPGDPNSTANTIEWGCSNDTDEYMFQLKGSQFSIIRRSIIPMTTELLERQGLRATNQSSSVVYPPNIGNTNGLWETVIPRNKFNGDALLGSGDSGHILSFEEVTMYKIEYSWYGAIGAKFYAYVPIGNGDCRWVLLHTFIIENGLGQPVLANPDFKFKYLISTTDTTDMKKPVCLYKYGSSYYVDGGDEGTMRLATTTVDKKPFSTRTPILGILPKETIRNSEGIGIGNFKKSYPTTISVNSSRDCKITIEEVFGSPSGVHYNFSPSIHMNGRHPDTRLLDMSYDTENPGPNGIDTIRLKQPPAKTFPNAPPGFTDFPVSFLTGFDFYDPEDPALVVPIADMPWYIPFEDEYTPAIGTSVIDNQNYRILFSTGDLAKFSISEDGTIVAGYPEGNTGTVPEFNFRKEDGGIIYHGRPESPYIKVLSGVSNVAQGVYKLINISNDSVNLTATAKIVNLDGSSLSGVTTASDILYSKLLNISGRPIKIGDVASYAFRDPRILRPQFYYIQTMPNDNLVKASWLGKYTAGASGGYVPGAAHDPTDPYAPWRAADLPPSGFNSTSPKDITDTATTLSVNTNCTITGANDFQLSAGDLIKVRPWDQTNITPGIYKVASTNPVPSVTTFRLVQNDNAAPETEIITTENSTISHKVFTVVRSAIGKRIVSVGDTIGFYGGGQIFNDWNPSVGEPDNLDSYLYTVTEIIDDQNFRVDRNFPDLDSSIWKDAYWPQQWAGDPLNPLEPDSYQGFGIPIVRAFQQAEDKAKIISDGIFGQYVGYSTSVNKQSTQVLKRSKAGSDLYLSTARDSLKKDGSRVEPDQTNPATEFSAYVSALRTIVGSDVGIKTDSFKIHFLIPRVNRDALTNSHFADWSVGVTPYKPTAPDAALSETYIKFQTGSTTYKSFDYSEFPMCDYSHSRVDFSNLERAETGESDRSYIRAFQVDRRYVDPKGADSGYIAAIKGKVTTEDHKVSAYAIETAGIYNQSLKITFDSTETVGPTASDIQIIQNPDSTISYLSEVGIDFGGTGYNFISPTLQDAETGARYIYAERVKDGIDNLEVIFDNIIAAGDTVKIQTKLLILSDALEAQSLDQDGQPKFTNTFTKTQAIRFSDTVLYPVFALSDYAKVNGIVIEEISPDDTVRSFTPNFITETGNSALSILSSGGSGSDKTPSAFNPGTRLSANRYDTQTLNPLRAGSPIYSFYVGANDATQINLESIFSPDRKALTRGLLNNKAVFITATSMEFGDDGNASPGEIEMSVTIKEQ